ncbi:MAG: DNA gyrase modulator, partial [Pseudomonadota bacterium]
MTSEDAPFSPFETDLEQDTALSVLRDATAKAEDGELFLERRRAESLTFDDGRLRGASYDSAKGFGLRAVAGPVAGYAHSTELTETALRRAAETVKLAAAERETRLAPPPPLANRSLYVQESPLDGMSFGAKVDLLKEIDDYLRARDPRVVQVSATLAGALQEVTILRPEGGVLSEARPMARLNISVIVEKDGRRETGSTGGGGRRSY